MQYVRDKEKNKRKGTFQIFSYYRWCECGRRNIFFENFAVSLIWTASYNVKALTSV